MSRSTPFLLLVVAFFTLCLLPPSSEAALGGPSSSSQQQSFTTGGNVAKKGRPQHRVFQRKSSTTQPSVSKNKAMNNDDEEGASPPSSFEKEELSLEERMKIIQEIGDPDSSLKKDPNEEDPLVIRAEVTEKKLREQEKRRKEQKNYVKATWQERSKEAEQSQSDLKKQYGRVDSRKTHMQRQKEFWAKEREEREKHRDVVPETDEEREVRENREKEKEAPKYIPPRDLKDLDEAESQGMTAEEYEQANRKLKSQQLKEKVLADLDKKNKNTRRGAHATEHKPDSAQHADDEEEEDENIESPEDIDFDKLRAKTGTKIPGPRGLTREQRRKIRKISKILPYEKAKKIHVASGDKSAEDPGVCFEAATKFCKGQMYNFAQFVACGIAQKDKFEGDAEHCKEDFVLQYEDCSPDLVKFCPHLQATDMFRCLIAPENLKLLSKECKESELFEIMTQEVRRIDIEERQTEEEELQEAKTEEQKQGLLRAKHENKMKRRKISIKEHYLSKGPKISAADKVLMKKDIEKLLPGEGVTVESLIDEMIEDVRNMARAEGGGNPYSDLSEDDL